MGLYEVADWVPELSKRAACVDSYFRLALPTGDCMSTPVTYPVGACPSANCGSASMSRGFAADMGY